MNPVIDGSRRIIEEGSGEGAYATSREDLKLINEGRLLIREGKRFVPLPHDIYKEAYMKSGTLRKYYESLVDKIYDAGVAHKKYYDDTMAAAGYLVKDIIPTKKQIHEHIFTFDAFLFGWFALQVIWDENQRCWGSEGTFGLVYDFIEDVNAGREPRALRGV